MQPAQTAGELQQFLCAANRMRRRIPEYTRTAATLYEALERAAKVAGSRKKNKHARARFSDASWSDKEIASFEDVHRALLGMVPLAHPKPTADLCLYTHASQDFWGAVVTQLEPDEVSLPLEE
ncbi:hypothetical protein PI124_g1146 [Phytophthora idaei]|nr:hypothetical protein PI124_g1146 [Phytophthora idaei]